MKVNKESTILYLQSKSMHFTPNKIKCVYLQYIDSNIIFDAYEKWDNKKEFVKYYMHYLNQIPDVVMINLMKRNHESLFFNFDFIGYIENQCATKLCSIYFDIHLYYNLTTYIESTYHGYFNNRCINAYNKLKNLVIDHYLHII
jgi:hypothetical protein